MGIFDRRAPDPVMPSRGAPGASDDEQAIARYRYLLRTAPPEAIEQAHAEAFAQLTPEQRRVVLQELAAAAPEAERRAIEQGGAQPQALARVATRAELRRPGALERIFGAGAPGFGAMPGFGSMMAGSLLGSIAGTVLGSVIAREFFDHAGHEGLFGGAASPEHGLIDSTTADAGGLDGGLGDLGDVGDLGGFDGGTFDI